MMRSAVNASALGGDVAIDGGGLDAEAVRAILRRRAEVAAQQEAPRPAGVAAVICLIGGERFAVPLAAVAEVIAATTPVPLPCAPANLLGLITRRGAIFNLVDPAGALGVERGAGAHLLLLRGGVPRIALRVDEVVGADAVAGAAAHDGGLTATRYAADGGRVELIAVERLLAALGYARPPGGAARHDLEERTEST